MKYLIDTNICIYIINKRPAAVIKKFKQFELGEIGISTINDKEFKRIKKLKIENWTK